MDTRRGVMFDTEFTASFYVDTGFFAAFGYPCFGCSKEMGLVGCMSGSGREGEGGTHRRQVYPSSNSYPLHDPSPAPVYSSPTYSPSSPRTASAQSPRLLADPRSDERVSRVYGKRSCARRRRSDVRSRCCWEDLVSSFF